ncbi:hydantoinase/carbamoylase family amidase [Faecalispora anaeroviscerum]|uniref:hydantoinase/carbamoylase family amidase n=1 Tax=Faecalispora anaeroviscerum TaxID=2991836 RepID=UPI0024BBB060|nr:hydantoinase/carbamoylase family amidase [Faecalispora anaeroviscerum]
MKYKTDFLTIHRGRLQSNLLKLSEIGKNPQGGIDRWLCSEADVSARGWLRDYWKHHTDTEFHTDAIANLWAKSKGTLPLAPLVIGSHHDTVSNGGMYDGALGVLMATEILQTLQESGKKLRHPLWVVSFTAEEPNPFNISTLGSKVLGGVLKYKDLKDVTHMQTGQTLADAIQQIGGNLEEIDHLQIQDGQVAAFLECHIEQGRRLADQKFSSAAVSTITGIYREIITVTGTANHAGTTVMRDRQDALCAASEIVLLAEKTAAALHSDEAVATVGFLQIKPNSTNIIPASTEMILEMRTSDPGKKKEFLHLLTQGVDYIAESRGIQIQRKTILDQQPMPMNPAVIKAVEQGIEQGGQTAVRLVSMAGHDAAHMARVTRSGMIFAQSVNGKSHCADEAATMDDIEFTANAMLAALLVLDEELD